jgi:hypothetical protein
MQGDFKPRGTATNQCKIATLIINVRFFDILTDLWHSHMVT